MMLPVLLWDDEQHEALTVWLEKGGYQLKPKLLLPGTLSIKPAKKKII